MLRGLVHLLWLPASALECYHGRAFDRDMRQNVPGIPFRDEVYVETCGPGDACCIRVAASRCCTLESRKYSIADGACANASVCADLGRRDDLCAAYEADQCRSVVCRDDLCNDLTVFDSSNAHPRAHAPLFLVGVLGVGAALSFFVKQQ
mmetsp:Transcript_32943/g.105097  ORF Transcript_32943/g.105097 Transcript_32943/m.105097 type:complete len:149 (-) Transcript_32943:289-735(-)